MSDSEVILEPRPLYGIGTVSRLTGIRPDTLRVWERRYGLGASHKSASGRRQYTQADLEHLQLIAALVSDGSRIGEIARAERKTLEMLLRQRRGNALPGPAKRKPRALVIGDALCDWLDAHQGCLSTVDARVARVEFSVFDLASVAAPDACDVMVIECPSLGGATFDKLEALRATAPEARIIVCYRFGNERWIQQLEERAIVSMAFPPDPGRLAFALASGAIQREVSLGDGNLGELMTPRERQFGSDELSAARMLRASLDCECPRHIADLVEALATFEDYSADCSVENWHQAAVHACIYAYTAQARHLMEKAMQAVLEEREGDFRSALRDVRAKKRGVSEVA